MQVSINLHLIFIYLLLIIRIIVYFCMYGLKNKYFNGADRDGPSGS